MARPADEWEFAEDAHPVYHKPPEIERWPFALPGLTTPKYEEDENGRIIEPLEMGTEHFPSATIFQRGTATVQQVTLRSRFAQDMDLSEVEQIQASWLAAMRDMSQGPYTSAMLAEMGHPYGTRPPATLGDVREDMSWTKRKRRPKLPPMGKHAHIRGMRGRVSNQSIVNKQSGNFERRWSTRVLRWFGGINLMFVNSAFYAWFLAHGTIYMHAHGPWATVAQRFLPRLHKAWRLAAYYAWRRAYQQRELEQRAIMTQFGPDALTPSPEAEPGGFS